MEVVTITTIRYHSNDLLPYSSFEGLTHSPWDPKTRFYVKIKRTLIHFIFRHNNSHYTVYLKICSRLVVYIFLWILVNGYFFIIPTVFVETRKNS